MDQTFQDKKQKFTKHIFNSYKSRMQHRLKHTQNKHTRTIFSQYLAEFTGNIWQIKKFNDF